MTARRRAMLTFLKISDLAVIIGALIVSVGVALGGTDMTKWYQVFGMRVTVTNALFMAIYMTTWHFVLRGAGLYHSYRLAPASREVGRLGVAVVIGVLPLVPVGQLLSFGYVTAPFIVTFTALAFLGLVVERRGMRLIAGPIRRRGMNLRNIVIIGDTSTALDMSAALIKRSDLGYRILPLIKLDPDARVDDVEVEVSIKNRLEAFIETEGVDEVFIALPLVGSEKLIRRIISHCEEQGVMVRVLAQIANLSWARLVVDEVAGQPVLSIFSGPPDTARLAVKRAIDIFASLVGLILLSPLFIAVSIAIKLDSPGPVFFVQERIGLNRRRFMAYKLRTMVNGADVKQADVEHLNEADGPVFKIKHDPRITKLGRWLRRTSIDELPQLLNVLQGNMSLVGPRPLPVRDVERMDVRWHKRRFAVKPGITCLWQAQAREPNFEEWIKSDMEYIDTWSLKLDFKILLRTIPAVFTGHGAY